MTCQESNGAGALGCHRGLAWYSHSAKEPGLTGRHGYSLQSLFLLITSRRNLRWVLFSTHANLLSAEQKAGLSSWG